jgi:aminoglycoside phosphotransferase (APT) family kinase protein
MSLASLRPDERRVVSQTGDVVLHSDELSLDLATVRRLVDHDFPKFAHLALTPLDASGSSNALFRLGGELLVRLPRQPRGSETIRKENRWLPHVEQGLSVAVPRVIGVGEPGFSYPEQWSIVQWIDGEAPRVPVEPSSISGELAVDLAHVVLELRSLAVPPDALKDPALRWYRAEPLNQIDTSVRTYLDECRVLPRLDLDVNECLRIWGRAMDSFGDERPSTHHWVHGDLFAENLLLREGRLAAVLDFGGLSVGDPTVDLICGWESLDKHALSVFRGVVDVDELTWIRGRAWALAIGVMTFPYYWKSMPDRCANRLTMVRAVLDDARSGV